MSSPVFTIKIAGPAGFGIKSSGLLLSQILINHGFYTIDYSEYPSLVRGGHNTYQVSFSVDKIYSVHQTINLFISLFPNHWQDHRSEFTPKTLIFSADKNNFPTDDHQNTFGLGVAARVFNLNLAESLKLVSIAYPNDQTNLVSFEAGYRHAQDFPQFLTKPPKYSPSSSVKLYDGNESFGWGFIKGGGNFYAAYPMTPSTGTLHFLASKQDKFNIKVIHPEDEIAAASLVAGAVFAGARAALGTSGGGFALMNETVSFCGIANLGAVFYLVSRPGPATGMPTWTSQGDLLHALNAGHGELPLIVLAPSSQVESFDLGILSLNLAAKYHLPVIVLSDKTIAESAASVPDFSLSKSKIITSSLPIPGTKDQEFMANSYEHDISGFATEDSRTVIKNVNSRFKKLTSTLKTLPKPIFYGSSKAKKLIITWGSPVGTVLETIKTNPSFALLQFRTLWPIDPKIELLIKPFKQIFVVENNATSQLTSLLKSQFDFHPTKIILKFDGRPFFPEELKKQL